MNKYYPLLNLVFINQPCTRFYLEHIQSGRFKDMIGECIRQNYIEKRNKNENNDDLYYITEKGKKIIDNPLENTK